MKNMAADYHPPLRLLRTVAAFGRKPQKCLAPVVWLQLESGPANIIRTHTILLPNRFGCTMLCGS
jgi:hypothetical protein